MKVWWCELHRAAESAEEGICEVGARMLLVPGPYPKTDYPEPCQIVEMQLVPADALWQFNEAVSLLHECRGSVMEPVLVREIDKALPAMQSALEALAP